MVDIREGDRVYIYHVDALGRRMGRSKGTVEYVSRVGADVRREDGYLDKKVAFENIEKIGSTDE